MYLEGSVEILGEEIRVNVQLIDSETSFHLWSRTFNQPREGFFDIRDEITSLTVANVRVALPPDTRSSSLKVIEDPSLNVYVLYRRGIEALRQPTSINTISSALGWFDAALNIDPKYAAAHAGKCESYLAGYGEVDDASFIDQGEASCATALELNPNLDVVHAALGRLYTSTGRYEAAERSYRRALQIDPSSAASFIGLGKVYQLQNRGEEAESNLRLAIGLHPGDWWVHNQLGNFLYRSGRFEEASTQYEYVVALDHENMNGYSNLGTAHMLGGKFLLAASAFQKALDIEPRKITYGSLGLMHYYLGDLESSIANHLKAVELEPNDYLARSNLGDALWVAGRTDEATAAFERANALATNAIQVNPSDPFTLMDLAWINAMLGKPDAARARINKALELAPEDPYTHYIDALILVREGDNEAALSSLETAVEMGYSRQMLAAEPHLETLRLNPRFAEIAN